MRAIRMEERILPPKKTHDGSGVPLTRFRIPSSL